MRIYTRTGDKGATSLFSGGRVSKTHPRLQAYGTVDELNSNLGLALSFINRHEPLAPLVPVLTRIQEDLFTLGSDLATPLDAKAVVPRVSPEMVTWAEGQIDHFFAEVPELRVFVLPGGSESASALHVARTVCRRAERLTVEVAETEVINADSVTYLNRLSDLLFVLARWANVALGVPEPTWNPAK